MGKLQRNYRLTVDSFSGPIVIEPPLSLEFDVVRSTLKSAGHASFRVMNLSETRQNQLRKDINLTAVYKGIELRAGYGDTIPLIFKGNVSQGWSAREGNNKMVTTLQTYDGAFGIINSESSSNVPEGGNLRQGLVTLLGDMEQVRIGEVGAFLDGDDQPVTFPRGLALNGNTADLLDQLSGGNFFIDLETGHCLADHECLQGSYEVISSDTGLLGTPILEQNRLTFDIIFEPRLLLAQRVILKSFTARKFNGEYKVFSLRHRGTISDTVAGKAVTTVTLWQPGRSLVVVN